MFGTSLYPHWQHIFITAFFEKIVSCTLLLLSQQLLYLASILSEIMSNRWGGGDDRIKTKPNMRTQQQHLPSFIPVGNSKVSAQGTRLNKQLNISLLKVYKRNQFLLRSNLGTILMYVPCILYILLARPTNTQRVFLNNILNTYLRYTKYY
jgi:hypothetical protein